MASEIARNSLSVQGIPYSEQQLAEAVSPVGLEQEFQSLTLYLRQLAEEFDLTESQRTELSRIMETDLSELGVLVGQMTKCRRRLLAARCSPVFHEAHESTLLAEQRTLTHV